MTACKATSEACQLTTSLCHPQTPTCAISKWHTVYGGLLPDGPMMAVAGVLHPADSSPQAVCKWRSLISHSQTKTDGPHSLQLGSMTPQAPSYKPPHPDLLTQCNILLVSDVVNAGVGHCGVVLPGFSQGFIGAEHWAVSPCPCRTAPPGLQREKTSLINGTGVPPQD
ncbi:hypothetical protein AOLI_G00053160 [Acnodon oligacanthus]